MLHELLFLAFYLGLIPIVLVSAFAGVLIYYWLDYLPPDFVYSVSLLPSYLSFTIGALAFVIWVVREKKTPPRPFLVPSLMIALLLWVNVTSLTALVPSQATFEWTRTVKVIGFAILTAQMLTTRARLEAFVWAFVLATIYFAVPGAIKVIISGGSGGIGAGEVVEGSEAGFFGDRVFFSVVLGMGLPLALYLARQATLVPARWLRWVKPGMLGAAGCFLIALVGTFARTALLTGGATLLMLAIKSRRKLAGILGIAAVALALFLIAPENWLERMDTIVHYQNDASAVDRVDAWKWAWQFTLEHPIFGGGFGVFVLDAGHISGKAGWLEAHNIFFQVMAEHGFVGLGLFCLLMGAVYHGCAIVQNRARGHDEYAWVAELGRAVQIALVAYIVGGFFVSAATTPFLYFLAGIATGIRGLVERELPAAGRRGPLVSLRLGVQPTRPEPAAAYEAPSS
jgi:putative inorganic carbon (hco3(-)) transporter